ncbi:MAG: hypothetical protein WD509_01325 [Candidatus Paceibacterota bacterium]
MHRHKKVSPHEDTLLSRACALEVYLTEIRDHIENDEIESAKEIIDTVLRVLVRVTLKNDSKN